MRARVALFGFVVATTSHCGPEAESPPPVTCSGGCFGSGPNIVGQVPPSGGDAGEGGQSGAGDGDGPVRLQGDIWILNDVPKLTATRFQEPAELVVEGTKSDVMGRYTGLDPFSLDGVKRSSATWALATPGPGDALPSLQPIDTSKPSDSGEVTTALTLARESELERALSVITQPIAPDFGAAQLVLVVKKGNSGVAGVRVTAKAAQAVIYVDGVSYSDAAEATDASGVVLIANVAAQPWPGSGVTVTLTGELVGRWDLRVVAGAVTFAGIGE